MKEMWKSINEYPDYYVSNFGRIKKKNYKAQKNNNNVTKIIKPIKHTHENNTYLTIRAKNKYNNYKTVYVHRLVAEAFIPNPQQKPCVNHIDGSKSNNNVNNLEWVTYSENMIHAKKYNLWKIRCGKNNKRSLTYVELDMNYNFIRKFIGSREENKRLGYTKDTIQRCARGVTKSTHNKIYLLKEEYFENNKNKTKEIHLKKYEINKKKKRKYRNKKTSQTSNVLADMLF